MTTLETLKASRTQIVDPKNWTQRVIARDASGKPVAPCSMDASSWCILGALSKLDDGTWEAEKCLLNALPVGAVKSLGDFNDTHTHSEVLALFDKAIASLETA